MAIPNSESEFLGNFDTSDPPPGELLQLLAFELLAPQSSFSGNFTLYKWPFGKSAWTDNEKVGQHLVVFGHNDDNNSLYAFWRYDGRSVRESPIVYLDSEGIDCALVADNVADFLALLAVDTETLGYCCFDADTEYEGAERIEEFRTWLLQQFQIAVPSDPASLVAKAQAAHPSFSQWLDQQMPPAPTPPTDSTSILSSLLRWFR